MTSFGTSDIYSPEEDPLASPGRVRKKLQVGGKNGVGRARYPSISGLVGKIVSFQSARTHRGHTHFGLDFSRHCAPTN